MKDLGRFKEHGHTVGTAPISRLASVRIMPAARLTSQVKGLGRLLRRVLRLCSRNQNIPDLAPSCRLTGSSGLHGSLFRTIAPAAKEK